MPRLGDPVPIPDSRNTVRLIPLSLAILLALPLAATAQSESDLPDIGSSAGALITPAQEVQYGGMYLRELRRHGYLLEDPLVESWLQGMAYRLVAASGQRAPYDYTFFLMGSRQINAFATLGGFIGTNAGLVLNAESEDEVAAVMAHEIAHVTQRHIVRSVERAQKDAPLILLGMIAALAAAQQAGSSAPGASQAAIAGGMGLMQQRQINFTRSNEHEADRLGIQTLARAGYDPGAMAAFFGRLQRTYRTVGFEGYVPDYLRTHPVTTTRISEARDRAAQVERCSWDGATLLCSRGDGMGPVLARSAGTGATHSNPLLREDLVPNPAAVHLAPLPDLFPWARERLRVLSATSAQQALTEYNRLFAARQQPPTDAERYGRALAMTRVGDAAEASTELAALAGTHPGNYWVELALAEAEFRAGRRTAALARLDDLDDRLPGNRAIALAHASMLGEVGTPEAGRRAREVLRPLLAHSAGDPVFQRSFARACELAGDEIRAAEAHAEVAYLNGRAFDALSQLEALQKRDDLDYVQRARIDARIAQLTPVVLEMQRQGIGPRARRG